MSKRFRTALAVMLVSCPGIVAAQSSNDFAAYYALMNTHIGVFAPVSAGPVKGVPRTADGLTLRLSSYKEEGETDGVRTIGMMTSMDLTSEALLNITAGYAMPGCELCDPTVMIGADVIVPMWAQLPTGEGATFTANLQASGGFGKYTGGSAITTYALAGTLPLGVRVRQSSGSSLSGFFTPGFAWGSAGTSGNMTSGTRPFFGLGGEWQSAAGWTAHLGIHRVVIERGPTTIGGGVGYRFGGK